MVVLCIRSRKIEQFSVSERNTFFSVMKELLESIGCNQQEFEGPASWQKEDVKDCNLRARKPKVNKRKDKRGRKCDGAGRKSAEKYETHSDSQEAQLFKETPQKKLSQRAETSSKIQSRYCHWKEYVSILNNSITSSNYAEVFTAKIDNAPKYQLSKFATQSVALLSFYNSLIADPGILRENALKKQPVLFLFQFTGIPFRTEYLILKVLMGNSVSQSKEGGSDGGF